MPAVLYLLAIALFAQGTSEFVLAGLLAPIAVDLHISIGSAGLLTAAYALGIVVGAPAMALAARRLSPARALVGFLVLFTLAHVIGATTSSFGVLLTTRAVAAVANAGFIAVSLASAARLVAPDRQARAVALLVGGTTLALIAGVPLGALIGTHLGWRAALWGIAAVCVPVMVGIALGMPRGTEAPGQGGRAARPAPQGPGDSAPTVGQELRTLRRLELRVVLVLAALVNGATFGSFTFLAVIATDVAGVGADLVPAVLAIFGCGAFLGVMLSGRYGDRRWRQLIRWGTPALGSAWLGLAIGASSVPIFLILVPVGATTAFVVGSTLIARVMAASHGAPTLGCAFATVALNVGAMLGPILAGLSVDAAGARAALAVSAGLVGFAVLLLCSAWVRRRW